MQKLSNDILGIAYMDYFLKKEDQIIYVNCNVAEVEELPVSYFFRDTTNMPKHEKMALKLCKGRILDAGAGAGCHTLVLQNKGFQVKAIDISKLGVEVMKKRGVVDCECKDIFSLRNEKFDTILLLMTGIGMVETLIGLDQFFMFISEILTKNGQLIVESSDISYTFEDKAIELKKEYYGEITYKLSYKSYEGKPFNWLYVDFYSLKGIAEKYSFDCNLIYESNDGNYLVQIERKTRKKIDG